jgi:hypothetical protein
MSDKPSDGPCLLDRTPETFRDLSENEAAFRRLIDHNARVLWALDAVDATMSALWDVVSEAAGPYGVRAALLAHRNDNS